VMLHGLEDCRILGVDDAFQSELRGGQLWKIACERLLLAVCRPGSPADDDPLLPMPPSAVVRIAGQ
jgi:hypothetical protein